MVVFVAVCKDESFKNQCKTGENMNIISNEDFTFNVYINQYYPCHNVKLTRLGTTNIRLRSKINEKSYFIFNLDIKREDNCYSATLSHPKPPYPIKIINLLPDKNINVFQHDQSIVNNLKNAQPMIIGPNAESLFAKEQPFLEKELHDKYKVIITVGNKKQEYIIPFEKDHKSQKIDDTKDHFVKNDILYDVITKDHDNKEIIIYSSKNTKKKKRQIIPMINKIFDINIIELKISYIDRNMNELFLFYIKKLVLNVDLQNKLSLEIENIGINDMYVLSKSPVVLYNKGSFIFKLNITTNHPLNMLLFDTVEIELAPLHLYFQLSFISDIIAVFFEINNYINLNRSQEKSNISNSLYIFAANKFIIKPIDLCVLPYSSSDRKFRFEHPDYYNIMRSKIPVENKLIEIKFKELEVFDVHAPFIDFAKLVFDNYTNLSYYEKMNILWEIVRNCFNKQDLVKNFSDLLDTKNLDIKNKYPLRIPRSFPLRRVFTDFTKDSFIIKCSLAQFAFQNQKECGYENEHISELYEFECSKNESIKFLAIYDNYLALFKKDVKKTFLEIYIKEITSIEVEDKKLHIHYNSHNIQFYKCISCNSKMDALSIKKKINSIQEKINLFDEYINMS